MIICNQCGKENADGSQFCAFCGTKLVQRAAMKRCPFCQAEIPAEAAFCHHCGKPQTAAAQPARQAVPDEDEPIKVQPMVAPSRRRVVEDLDLEEPAQEEPRYERKAAAQSTRRSAAYDDRYDEDDDYDYRRGRRSSRYDDRYDDDYDDYEDEGMGLGLKILIAVLSIAVVLVLAFAAFMVLGRGGRKNTAQTPATKAAVETQAAQTAAQPTAAPTTAAPAAETEAPPAQTYGQPQALDASVSATSVKDNYRAGNLIDFNADTIWAEAEPGLGEGVEINYVFSGKQWVYGIAVMPGYQLSQDHYNKYGAPTRLTVDTGSVQIPISLEKYTPNFSNPTSSVAYFQFSQPVQTDALKVKLDAARKGTDFEDVCMSELFFYTYPSNEAQAASSRPRVYSSAQPQQQTPQSQASGENAQTGSVPAGTDGDYLLPNSNSAYLTDEDLAGLSKEQLRIARNEIYARHGYEFGKEDLKTYFGSKSWYHAGGYDDSQLNEYELANIKKIKNKENAE